MSDCSPDRRSLPVERYPDPVCRYVVDEGGDSRSADASRMESETQPVVCGVNPAFEATFGPIEEETPVRDALGDLGVSVRGVGDVQRALTEGESFTAVVDEPDASSRRYPVRTVPPADDDPGFLVFTAPEEGGLGIDHVASVVSHDLRNPLEVAKTRLDAGRELDEDDHFEYVAQAHERMERIIQDVLTLARGDAVVDPSEPVALGDIAERAWETVDTDGATLTVSEDLPTAVADPDRVTRLFENLFRNSVEHGGAAVGVTIGRLDDGFYVADDGPGIPESDRERVFDPGYSSDDHGTGLGLAIVARIADAHDWTVGVTDSDAGGARIEVRSVDAE
jgi:hypothetical protein